MHFRSGPQVEAAIITMVFDDNVVDLYVFGGRRPPFAMESISPLAEVGPGAPHWEWLPEGIPDQLMPLKPVPPPNETEGHGRR